MLVQYLAPQVERVTTGYIPPCSEILTESSMTKILWNQISTSISNKILASFIDDMLLTVPTTVPASCELGNTPAWALCLPTNVPFPPKLCGMLMFAEQMDLTDVVSWLPHGRAFRIHDPDGFMTRVASKFLTAKKLRSVHRQLLCWGFQRIEKGEDKGAWFHKSFVRGEPVLMKDMIRTKVKGKVVKSTSAMPNFLSFLDGRVEQTQKPPLQPGHIPPLSQELSSLFSRSFAGNLHQGALAHYNLSRSASCPERFSEPTSAVIEPLPFRGHHSMVPFNNDECTLFVGWMIRGLSSKPFADGLRRGASITEPTSHMIERLPFHGNHDKVPSDDSKVSPFIDQTIQESLDEFSLFIDWTIYDPNA